MRRILLVEDDPDQLEVRKLTLEAAGYQVDAAQSARAGFELFWCSEPAMVIMDLRLPHTEDGLTLIRQIRGRSATVRIIVVSGWASDLAVTPERAMVDQCLAKPVRSRHLLDLIAKLMLWCFWIAALAEGAFAAQEFRFAVERPAEVVADLGMSSPGSNWGEAGREAALATVTLDGAARQSVMLYAGAERHPYSVFLGSLAAGEHRLSIERDGRYSAPGSGLHVATARFREIRPGEPFFPILANAPVLYARADTIGRFTDVPMIVYCERLRENGQPLLEYTILYSNEDGGTSTRALMARWGRTTDIDYGYKAYQDAAGHVVRATIQAKDHKEIEFRGRREGAHPVLIVATDNNMVSDEGESAIRYQIAPILVNLSNHSREEVMDEHPFTYRVMAEELKREGKLRPFGTMDGEKVSDPRNYLYFEANLVNRETALAVLVRRRGEDGWRSSDLGRLDYAISRDGWVRTTVELPPGTRPADIAEIAFQCFLIPDEKGKWPPSNACRVEALSKSFFLRPEYLPGPNVFALREPSLVPAGVAQTHGLRTGPARTSAQ